MKHRNNVLQLSFAAESDTVTIKIGQKLIELSQRKAALEAEAKKIHPQGSKLLKYFEQKSVSSQVALLKWLLEE